MDHMRIPHTHAQELQHKQKTNRHDERNEFHSYPVLNHFGNKLK